jgi:hypothetical protein
LFKFCPEYVVRFSRRRWWKSKVGMLGLKELNVYCKPWNFSECFIFANALSTTNLKQVKISTLMH